MERAERVTAQEAEVARLTVIVQSLYGLPAFDDAVEEYQRAREELRQEWRKSSNNPLTSTTKES